MFILIALKIIYRRKLFRKKESSVYRLNSAIPNNISSSIPNDTQQYPIITSNTQQYSDIVPQQMLALMFSKAQQVELIGSIPNRSEHSQHCWPLQSTTWFRLKNRAQQIQKAFLIGFCSPYRNESRVQSGSWRVYKIDKKRE